ncbi:hypothetical protein [Bacillus massiliglaciei]|uniref:hypothetical protein n=1 Tax=Bacillus massiliglaciei TaxID=1816693 RepID=UPI000DA5EE22|nr:hypothetical protein [Bacillus massiliglaciei]
MIALSSMNELKETEERVVSLKDSYPELFKKLLHVVGLTRAFQFKYQYMGSLIMGDAANPHTPEFVMPSILSLYVREVEQLKCDPDITVLQQLFTECENIGYAKICMLVLGNTPESLLGTSYIK